MTRTRHLKLILTPAEARKLYARASRRRVPISSLVRQGLGWEIPDTSHAHEREPSAADGVRLKIRVSAEEYREVRDEAATAGVTVANYLRRAIGLPARQNRVGAPNGNRNRVRGTNRGSRQR